MFSIPPDLYDAIYSFKNYADEAQKIQQLIRAHCPGAKSILDVACGTGEHARHLSTHFTVEGIDINPQFVKSAQAKNPAGSFRVADMRSFQLDRRYDVVQCLFSSIGYMLTPDDTIRALRCFRDHVAPGGVVLVEPWISPAAYITGPPHMIVVDRPDLKVCRMNIHQRDGNISKLHFHYLVATSAGVQHLEETHHLALVAPEQMSSYFDAAGLRCTFDPIGLFARGLFIAQPIS